MGYLSVSEIAKKWHLSERAVRNYCAQGRVSGAFLTGKTWNIPEDAQKISLCFSVPHTTGTLYGVLGIEMLDDYLCSHLPYGELGFPYFSGKSNPACPAGSITGFKLT